jgi:hypothetical protein
MSEGERDIGRWRVRALSLASSAAIVVGACLSLVLASRVTTYFDDPGIRAVVVEMNERPAPTRRSAPPRAPTSRQDAAATPVLTPLPVGREMLARTLSCLHRRAEDRPADCPPVANGAPDFIGSSQLPIGGEAESGVDLNQIFTPAELRTLRVDPPCVRGLTATSGCIAFGITPPPPTPSPIEACEAGGIGPCRPPEFRPEDVIRLPHTN